ncbi:hypothetical protein GJU39_15725 [Pedobacter petrophilus]|uniref:Uncharacterized protein n=1 Tax=Pedobacter petrophilus TaxID=1908241 RepID=A0A7K0G3H7_9SPHI|nr:hypothetical protein [Pedobacter petrophilus]MRX77536.1 hypothetical protein [Pedobacter petrophilus]
MNYIDKKVFWAQIKGNHSLSSNLDGYENKNLPEFNTINFSNGNNAYVNVEIIKSEKPGVKIPIGLLEQYDLSVDKNQTLQIKLTHPEKKLKYSVTIYIYANDIKRLNIEKASGFNLNVSTNTININAKDVNHLAFTDETKIINLNLNVEKVEDLNFGEINTIQNIDVKLNESNFNTSKSFFKSLNIVSTGHSNIDIFGDEQNKNKYKIDFLSVKTTGKASLNLADIKIAKSTGDLSDSTKVSMPAFMLKTMFK